MQDIQIEVLGYPTSVGAISTNPDLVDKRTLSALTATVQGNQPSGSVQFFDGPVLLSTAYVNVGDIAIQNNQTKFTATGVAMKGGFRKITAAYSGDAKNQSSTSDVKLILVNPDAAATLQLLLQ
jgi:hypothetical protein